MPIINITVKNKIANDPLEEIVCWNSDYVVQFTFDEEWDDHVTKTARFSYNGTTEDVVFDGFTVPVPKIRNANTCAIGVFAGDIATTTPAIVRCKKSILCENGVPADPTPDVYTQLVMRIDTVAQKTVVIEEQTSTANELATDAIAVAEDAKGTSTAAFGLADQALTEVITAQQTADNALGAIGDIETALDGIIAIQTSLIGGAE